MEQSWEQLEKSGRTWAAGGVFVSITTSAHRCQGCEAVGSMDQPSFTGWYWVGGGLDTGLLGGTYSPLPDKLLTLVFPP